MMKGMHLKQMMFSFLSERSKLESPYIASVFVQQVCKIVQMTAMGQPIIYILDPGLDAVLSLKESHIYLMTWPETGLGVLEVFSCNDYDEKKIAPVISCYYNTSKIKQEKRMDISVDKEVEDCEKSFWKEGR